MNSTEKRSLVGLSLLYVFRMMGLFMVLPVMMSFGTELELSTPFLLGIALGIYGVTQAFLQIPLGWLSDRIGRKQVISMGLVIFALGSFVAAFSDNVYLTIAGRALQGAGAIASATMALLTDLTREQYRTRAMAVVGVSIGLSFTIAMILGPVIAGAIGLSGLFAVVGVLALTGLLILWVLVPQPNVISLSRETRFIGSDVIELIKNPSLSRLSLGIFSLHLVLMAAFVSMPLVLIAAGLESSGHGWFYLPVMLVAFVLMMPFMMIAERKGRQIETFRAAIAILLGVQLLMVFNGLTVWTLGLSMVLFFAAFNFLEASMPSWLSRLAPAGLRGTAMGIFSTSQFIGAALGGTIGGKLFELYGHNGVFIFTTLLLFLWFIATLWQKAPERLTTITLKTPEVGKHSDKDHWIETLTEQLLSLDGVQQVRIDADERAAYLKVNPVKVDTQEIEKMVALAAV